ncbi:hypothetical protein BEK98_45605 [Streptomyces diastatochromogenes]|uniref:Uncharacterized protein n=1 Tax=Streptomyces diastatochromogenes TaxID=42236 RepID=A0A233RQC8_STRDA|nr:hypothetical protein BEK98_45605 [Streptomyces diastatochromogenes]
MLLPLLEMTVRFASPARSPSHHAPHPRPDTAEERYTTWAGRYSQKPTVVIQLIKETSGQEHALRTWTAQGETASENK